MERLICDDTPKGLEKSRQCCQHGQSVLQTRFNPRKRLLLNLVNIGSSRVRNIRRMIWRTQHIYSPINVETSSTPTKRKLATATTVSFFLLLSVAPDEFLASTSDGSRPPSLLTAIYRSTLHTVIAIAHCHRHSQNHKELKKKA